MLLCCVHMRRIVPAIIWSSFTRHLGKLVTSLELLLLLLLTTVRFGKSSMLLIVIGNSSPRTDNFYWRLHNETHSPLWWPNGDGSNLTRFSRELLTTSPSCTDPLGHKLWWGSLSKKILELAQRKEEARIGKAISLYSAPFYISRFRYKLCLRLYMDGDGSGKKEYSTSPTCLSTIMKGEYDALLPWPFQQTVSLLLLDQNMM